MATEALSNSLYRCFSKKAYESAMQDRQINASLWKNVEVIGYELEYKKKNAGSMLLPYGANAAGIADVIYTGSTIPQKRAGLKKVKLEAWNTNEFNGNAFLYGKQAAINERSEEEKQFWNLYDEYVHQHYLSYPEFLKKTKNYDYYVSMMGSSFPYVGQSVSSSELVDMGYSIKGLDGLPIKLNAEELSQIIYVSALPPNVDRIDVAEQLAWTMTSGNSTYSWNLDRLKDGEDPVEHFLNNTRKGYCTHYASAAALLLRSIGVPTRYVTGYIVNADSFEQKKDGSYEAKVIDRNDHAWIEIYLDGIGWIPYEVTPGYDSESKELPTSKEQEQARREAESTPEPQEESSEATPEPVVTATPGPTKEPTISVTPEPKKEKSKQKEEGGKSAKDGGSEKEQAKWPIFVCIGAVLIVGVVSTVLLRKRAAARKLERALRSRYYKAAVVIMNRRIYRKLRRSGRIKKDCRSDAEFEAALRTAFNAENQEWISQYMRVAKAAAFSGGSLSKEDCQFVQKVYQMVK